MLQRADHRSRAGPRYLVLLAALRGERGRARELLGEAGVIAKRVGAPHWLPEIDPDTQAV